MEQPVHALPLLDFLQGLIVPVRHFSFRGGGLDQLASNCQRANSAHYSIQAEAVATSELRTPLQLLPLLYRLAHSGRGSALLFCWVSFLLGSSVQFLDMVACCSSAQMVCFILAPILLWAVGFLLKQKKAAVSKAQVNFIKSRQAADAYLLARRAWSMGHGSAYRNAPGASIPGSRAEVSH